MKFTFNLDDLSSLEERVLAVRWCFKTFGSPGRTSIGCPGLDFKNDLLRWEFHLNDASIVFHRKKDAEWYTIRWGCQPHITQKI